MKQRRFTAVVLSMALTAISFPVFVNAEAAADFSIVNLKTEGRVDPIGIDTATPAFSWQMDSSAVGAAQTAYQITVKDQEGIRAGSRQLSF